MAAKLLQNILAVLIGPPDLNLQTGKKCEILMEHPEREELL